jgi:pyruvate/2-oxoglutarate dehydrogenase complex dihydrolipoamide acyltransferase (E2) component
MNHELELPDLGSTAGGQATVSEWLVEEGEFIEKDETVVEVVAGEETLDIPSPVAGVLVDQCVAEGDLVRVGDVLAIIECREEPSDEA